MTYSLNQFIENLPKFSEKLFFCCLKSSNIFDLELICLGCFGYLFNPYQCQMCKEFCCGECYNQKADNLQICLCIKSSIKNFVQIISLPFEAMCNRIPNSNFLENIKEDVTYKMREPFLIKFVNDELAHLRQLILDSRQKGFDSSIDMHNYWSLSLIKCIISHLRKCKINLKSRFKRCFSFIHLRKIVLKDLELCKRDAIKLQTVYLKNISAIEIINCNFELDFGIEFSKIIKNLQRNLVRFKFVPTVHNPETGFLFLRALNYCNNLNYLCNDMNVPPFHLTLKNFHNIFCNKSKLVDLSLSFASIKIEGNFDYFNQLSSLRNLEIISVICDLKIYGLIICHIFRLPLLLSFKFSNIFIKFYQNSILDINFFNGKETQLKFVKIGQQKFDSDDPDNYDYDYDSLSLAWINYFCTSQNLMNLTILDTFFWTNDMTDKEFAHYIKNTNILKKLKIKLNGINVVKNTFSSLKLNSSIESLDLSESCLNQNSLQIMELISTNHIIKNLNLEDCNLTIGKNFVNALSKNKSLEELNIRKNNIKSRFFLHTNFNYLKRILLGNSMSLRNIETHINKNLREMHSIQ